VYGGTLAKIKVSEQLSSLPLVILSLICYIRDNMNKLLLLPEKLSYIERWKLTMSYQDQQK